MSLKMRTLTIKIELENSAFQGFDEKFEINNILEEVIDSENIENKVLFDINGNKVGFCSIKDEKWEEEQ
jgi:hypothetical protein